ncbi:purine-nucleoside phosphorylase, partial [Phenoliferia sp. Uapishka_3]
MVGLSDSAIHACSGAAGGCVAMDLLHCLNSGAMDDPLVNLSTRAQVAAKHDAESVKDAMLKVIKQDGVAALYDGLTSSLLGIAITNGIYYLFSLRQVLRGVQSFEEGRAMLLRRKKTKAALSTLESMAASAIAGAATSILSNPIWVVNVRLYNTSPENSLLNRWERRADASNVERKLNVLQTILHIIRTDGFSAFFHGLGPALILVSNPILQFTLFEQLKNAILARRSIRLNKSNASAPPLTDLDFFLLGAISKLFATGITYPYLTVKARMQAGQAEGRSYSSSLDGLRKILKNEGVSGLYKGIGPKLTQSVATPSEREYREVLVSWLRFKFTARLKVKSCRGMGFARKNWETGKMSSPLFSAAFFAVAWPASVALQSHQLAPDTMAPNPYPSSSEAQAQLSAIRALLPQELHSPSLGIVCGSGLSGLGEILEKKVLVPYTAIPGFAESTGKFEEWTTLEQDGDSGVLMTMIWLVVGHKSALAFGYLGKQKVPVVCQLGRFHAYEGHPMSTVISPLRLMSALGISHVIITNAAGGLEPKNDVGTVVVLRDHISLPSLVRDTPFFAILSSYWKMREALTIGFVLQTSWNPLIGPNNETLGPRFPPMSDAYDFDFRKAAFRAARSLSWPKNTIKEGIYAWVAGPTYETRAEQRFLRAAGADVVGMSTVPEVIAARHLGVKVLVLSLVTNIVVANPYRSAEDEVDAELAGKPSAEESEAPEGVAASHQEN